LSSYYLVKEWIASSIPENGGNTTQEIRLPGKSFRQARKHRERMDNVPRDSVLLSVMFFIVLFSIIFILGFLPNVVVYNNARQCCFRNGFIIRVKNI